MEFILYHINTCLLPDSKRLILNAWVKHIVPTSAHCSWHCRTLLRKSISTVVVLQDYAGGPLHLAWPDTDPDRSVRTALVSRSSIEVGSTVCVF